VQQQIRMARGERLALRQSDIPCRGHAFECRINAEDPRTFRPSPGLITDLNLPGGWGVRIDTHAQSGYRVPPYYDSMVAKLIVHGATRADALTRLRIALDEMRVGGIATNLPLHRQLVADEAFTGGAVDIHYLERWLQQRAAA
jgi:acetyl-CoA carboxylase, biotin carboxylase subunit